MLKSLLDQTTEKSGIRRADVYASHAASPPKRTLAQPEEIANLNAFLVSDAGSAITMEDFRVNAGKNWHGPANVCLRPQVLPHPQHKTTRMGLRLFNRPGRQHIKRRIQMVIKQWRDTRGNIL
ncbi:SDR family oxidoreductase [Falsiruegeria litorea]|uniref:SDR family oxidoreductase n=1 Tax=Falsiruegeria litorea TaxID=1280831 RepID=UPI000A26F073